MYTLSDKQIHAKQSLRVNNCCLQEDAIMIDARLPWLAASSSRNELEAGSSTSVLQSIYGSQVTCVACHEDALA